MRSLELPSTTSGGKKSNARQLPPLRERGDDIRLLTEHFLKLYAKKYKKTVHSVSAAALKKLQSYSWPGNIRELRHTLERSVIMSENHVLQENDFLFPDQTINKNMFENFNLNHVEKTVIKSVLQKQGGNISRAAKELGLTRAALYRRMNKHDL